MSSTGESSRLTPISRNQEATETAFQNGMVYGALTLVPATGAVYYAMQNSKKFLARTNMQSRTALAIMPALFVFACTAEKTLEGKMQDIAEDESKHKQGGAARVHQWAKQDNTMALQQQEQQQQLNTTIQNMDMYRTSVEESNVSIVPGNQLGLHHKMANYVNDNPIKVLASLAVPSVAWIFYGNRNNAHLNFSMSLLHTRVFGQFATLSLLLGVMGFKEFMDQNGRFITEMEADARVAEMYQARENLLQRLEDEKRHQLELEEAVVKAHEEDVRDHNARAHTTRHHKKSYKKTEGGSSDRPAVAMSH